VVLKEKLGSDMEGFTSFYFGNKEEEKLTEEEFKKKTLEDLNPKSEDDKKEGECLSDKKEYEVEYNRHRIIVANLISKLFLHLLRHLQANGKNKIKS
jgi:hypothetical protein